MVGPAEHAISCVFKLNRWVCLSKDEVDKVLRAAPRLRSFDTDVQCSFQNSRTLLAGQGMYSVVHIRRLVVEGFSVDEVTRLARAIHLHPSLQELSIDETPLDTPVALGALVDAVISHGMTGLSLALCRLGPHSGTHLARLLRDAPRLSTLLIDWEDMFNAVSGPIFAGALRSSSLKILRLDSVHLWEHEGVGTVLVDALVGHPTVQEISLAHNMIGFDDPQNTVGACLARLVAANTPSLHTLSLASSDVGDDALQPVFVALEINSSLRMLFVLGNELSEPYVRDVVLPSLRANSALRKIKLVLPGNNEPAFLEAVALVPARQ